MSGWSASDIPDQSGRVAVVTGANSGLGLVTARELARRGALVVLACRDAGRGGHARDQIVDAVPGARLELRALDLADLASVEAFAVGVARAHERVDLLVNNAGIMAVPFGHTVDGFELQLGVDHLGPFALTGRLLPLLRDTPGARIVTVSSVAHKPGRIEFGDLMREQVYHAWSAYSQAKLANLLFAFELDRRLRRADRAAVSAAAHPGLSSTNLVGPTAGGSAVKEAVLRAGLRLTGQPDSSGALPQLYAATAPDIVGGDYLGPGGIAELRGRPTRVEPYRNARDEDVAQRLWAVSEELTGVVPPT